MAENIVDLKNFINNHNVLYSNVTNMVDAIKIMLMNNVDIVTYETRNYYDNIFPVEELNNCHIHYIEIPHAGDLVDDIKVISVDYDVLLVDKNNNIMIVTMPNLIPMLLLPGHRCLVKVKIPKNSDNKKFTLTYRTYAINNDNRSYLMKRRVLSGGLSYFDGDVNIVVS